jgi:hypothetical protein
MATALMAFILYAEFLVLYLKIRQQNTENTFYEIIDNQIIYLSALSEELTR